VGLLLVLLLAVALFLVVLLPLGLLARRGATRNAASEDAVVHESPAVVQRIWETGVTVKGNPQVGLVLSVEPERTEAFVVEVEQTMSRAQARRIRPGHVVTVRYRSTDPTRVVVVSLS
jgi:hypothetical protein